MNYDYERFGISTFLITNPRPVGIIVIGRNEGLRLERGLLAIAHSSSKPATSSVLYVDSGSTDGSVELARTLHIPVLELDPTKPFSAGRARREGADLLVKKYPYIEFLQFLDGDCTLEPTWLNVAIDHLKSNDNIGITCGRLNEEFPDASYYNRMNSLRWQAAPLGLIESCGGIFVIRKDAYLKSGGFNPHLLTGEESELCNRVRSCGYRITRIDSVMATHDSNLMHFKDWWNRAVWGGYGDALEYDVLNNSVAQHRTKETFSIALWVVIIPLLAVLGILGAIVFHRSMLLLPLFCLAGYFLLFAKIIRFRLKQQDSINDAGIYALLCIIRKFPYAIGFFRYRLNPASLSRRPDPHKHNDDK